MKTKMIKIISLAMVCVTLITGLISCGDSKTYEPDISYDTDIEGTYFSYKQPVFEFNSDTFITYLDKDVSDYYEYEYTLEPYNDKILKIKCNGNNTMYKYKNILVYWLAKINDFPKTKTFDYVASSDDMICDAYITINYVFTKDGYFYVCDDINNWQNQEPLYEYVRKNNIIYVHKDNDKFTRDNSYWQILFYIVGDYLIMADYIKPKD